MLLDVLSGLDELNIVTAYRYKGSLLESFPSDSAVLAQVELVCETLPGWSEEIDHCRSISELPANAQKYLARIEQLLSCPVKIVSIGPDRDATIYIEE